MLVGIFFFQWSGDHRELHVMTHSCPTRRSSGRVGEARITGVLKFGFFATVEGIGGDGLVPARDLGREYFRYDETAQQLVGEETGETYSSGQRLKLRLAEAHPVSGAMRLEDRKSTRLNSRH